MILYEQFLQADTASYEAFHKSFRIYATEDFNYGFDVLDALAEKSPNALALLYTNPAGEERRFTFLDMARQSNQAANYFRSLGIGKGDAVMLMLKRNYQYWFAAMGLCKLGAILIPATAQLCAEDIRYRNCAASVKMLLCANDPAILKAAEEAKAGSPALLHMAVANASQEGRKAPEGWLDFDEGMAAMPDTFLRPTGPAATRAGDPMLIYFTSGTTGHPKMALHDFLYPLGHIVTARFWQKAGPGGLHFTISDTGWAKAAWGKLYGQWLCECAVFVYDFNRFSAKEILAALQTYKIKTFCAPPTMYRMLGQENIAAYDLSSLTHCCSAGEPLNPEIQEEWRRHTGLNIYEGFGQSETTCCLGTLPDMPQKEGSMGRPMPGYHILLADGRGRPCMPGEAGEICIRYTRKTAGLFHGYYRDKALTEKVWHSGLYHTGDTAYMDEAGYFFYVGRADDIIKSSGYRIGPFEVESALLTHPAVLEAAVTGMPDELRGQVVKATIVLKEGVQGSDLLKKELQRHVKEVTAPYKYPRVIQFVDALPKTVSGKIKRAELRNAK